MAAARRAAASLLAADQRAAASLLLPAHRSAATSLLLAADLQEASSLLPAAASLLLAAHRRATNSLLRAADREEASSLLRAATSLLLAADRPAAASMFGPVPPSTVGHQLLLTDGRTSILAQRAVLCYSQALIRSADTTTPLTGCTSTIQIAAGSYTSHPTAASMFGPVPPSTVGPQLLLTDGRTSILAQRALLCNSQALIRSADTTTPLTGCTSTIQIAAGSYTSRPGRRALFSVPSLPTRNPVSALASATGSMLSRRGMATEAKEGLTPGVQRAVEATESLTPEVQQALKLMDAADAARHKERMKALIEFEADMMMKYSAGSLSSAETALTSSMVARRVSTAVFAFGVTTLLTVLLTVENGWKSDFQGDIQILLQQIMDELKSDLLAGLREVVRTELKKIDAEKAAPKKP